MARPKDPTARRAIVAQNERKDKMRRTARTALIALVVLLVLAGAAYGISKLPKPPGIIHYHAKYQVYANGNLESFSNPQWDGARYEPAHLHAPNYDIIHNEAREGDGTLGKFFQFDLDGKLTSDELVVPQGASFPGDYTTDANHTLQLLVSKTKDGKDWTKYGAPIQDYSFHDGDRLLILYGNYTSEQIQSMEDAFPSFDASKVA